ncbi:hypothetical protein METBIDRAFT_21783, partial [Metschnikowia bicuspidata var. bicuspidata NRRL YB-4993]
RKVLSRRKALQDFYKLDAARPTSPANNAPGPPNHADTAGDQSIGTPEHGSGAEDQDVDLLLQTLGDDKAMDEFLKTAGARDVLRVRNAAANRLNGHDLERKSIIYNNYSELIKLSHILNDVFDQSTPESEFSHAQDQGSVGSQNIDEYLAGLSLFLASEAAVFNLDFPSVV